MNRNDFFRLMGADSDTAEYLPVACLLRIGSGCVGNYNAMLNEDLIDTCVLVNARIIEFKEARSHATIQDFSDFLEEIVTRFFEGEAEEALAPENGLLGKAVPLTAIAFDEIAIVYPLKQMTTLLERAQKSDAGSPVPTFLDFEQSEILKLLRTKLW